MISFWRRISLLGWDTTRSLWAVTPPGSLAAGRIHRICISSQALPSRHSPSPCRAIRCQPRIALGMAKRQSSGGCCVVRSDHRARRGYTRFLENLGITRDRIGYLPDPTILWDFGEHLAWQERPGSGFRPLARSSRLSWACPVIAHPTRSGWFRGCQLNGFSPA